MENFLADDSKAKKMLKASAVMDFITAAIYLALSILLIILGVGMLNTDVNSGEDASSAGEAIGGAFAAVFGKMILIILAGMFFVIAAVGIIVTIVSVAYGGKSVSLLKMPIDVIARKVRAIKVGAIFGVIFFVALIIVGIIAAIGSPASIALFLGLGVVILATSIVNFKMVKEVELAWKAELERRQEAGEYYI
ncbi:MAG: hypothetical protein IK048_03145 [Clostridia bacterium]|nr:hypothetical protein [Clostridia bacterium]